MQQIMRWVSMLAAASCAAWLGGCATVIQSEVTAFHEWPAQLPAKTFVFERTSQQAESLEYRSYENLARAELTRLGFSEVENAGAAQLKVAMQVKVDSRDVQVIQPVAVNPWPYYGPYYGPHFGPAWPHYGYYPYAHPFWYGPTVIEQRESRYVVHARELKISIARRVDGRKLYDVTVSSEGTTGPLAKVMPYMMKSAFTDFPGPSGVPRRIRMKMEG